MFNLRVASQVFSLVQSLSHVRLFATPMDCSMPGLLVHHQLPEFTHIHVHWVHDAIQPSHPLLHPSPPAFNLSQHQGSIGVSAAASVLPMNTQDWFPLGWTGWISSVQGTLRSLLKNHSSKAPILQPLAFSIAQHPYPSIYDYWKNHSFE